MAGGTITIRTDPSIEAQLNKLAEAMERSRNWIIEEALKEYLATQAWQIEGIHQAQRSLAEGEGIPFDMVMADLQTKIDRAMKTTKHGQ
ncbi:MAG: ribbon-helix-helix protein, CopG family [Deltaproteobacteria bacterium]|nr:ribbon-helix-helix protein, CopG family [Deltaproteobacteria bacterium]